MRVPPGQHPGRSGTEPALRDLLPWAPTVLGVCALVVLLVIAATRFPSAPEARALPPAPPFLPAPAPALSFSPTVTVAPSPATPSPPTASKRPTRQVTAAVPRRPTRPPAPGPGPVGGRYRVVDSYDDAFIGEVLIANSSGQDRDWQVELRFPAAVGDLITSWVESAPQATLRRSGDSYIWSSGVPVPARARVALRFHFARSGSGDLPATCTVNDGACTGLR